MRTRRGAAAAVLLLTLASVAVAAAERFRFEGGSIDVPAGFTGPLEQRRGDEVTLYGFTKRHLGRESSTLMQITVYRAPSDLSQIPKDQEAREAERYLVQFLGGVERRRTNFSPGAVESIVVDGKHVARVKWRGQAEGHQMHGVMYCYINGRQVVTFHTQDFDFAPPDNMAAAVRAFESASLGEPTDRGRPATR
jgi:hypothetical protein